jgi:glycosyltransferase involved in cell wall biosynthesis
MKKLKLAYIVVMFPCFSETFVKREIIELLRRGHDVRIFSLRRFSQGIVDEDARPLISRTVYLPYLFSARLIFSNFHYLVRKPCVYAGILVRFLFALCLHPRVSFKSLALFPKSVYCARIAEREGIRHIHAHFVNYPATAAYIVHRLTGIPFSATAHAHDIFQNRFLFREKFTLAKRVCAISRYNRTFILDRCKGIQPDKIEVLHSGLDTAVDTSPAPRRPAGMPLIVSVGRMVDYKGFDVLLRALRLLKNRGARFRCIIGGDGPERERLQNLLAGLALQTEVEMVGVLERAAVVDLISRASLFVLACRRGSGAYGVMDGLPGVLYEAMNLGVPVVSSSISGIPELIEDGVSGLLVPPADAQKLADAIERLLKNDKLAQSLAAAGKVRIEQEFNIKDTVDRLIEVFNCPQ